jgi:cobalt-zinc-cadmium efflux system outer membrane protein
MRSSLVLVVVTALVLPPAGSLAQREPLRAVSYRAVGELADDAAPDVLLARANAGSARTEAAVAGMYSNPRVTGGTSTDDAAVYGQLYIELPVFGQREAAAAAADAQARVDAAGVEVARLDARLTASLAWIDLWLAEAQLRVAGETIARRVLLRDAARARFSVGGGSRLDAVRAEAEAAQARAEREALEDTMAAASARLATIFGEDAATASYVTRGPPPERPAPSVGALLRDLADHPVLARARTATGASDAAVRREHRSRWPLLYLTGDASLHFRFPPPANNASVQLGVDIPIFDEPRITRAEAQRDAAQVSESALEVQVRGALLGARADYLAAARRCRAQLDDALPAVREAAELSREAYTSGALDLTAALIAEQARGDAEIAAVTAIAERARALATLEHALGRRL